MHSSVHPFKPKHGRSGGPLCPIHRPEREAGRGASGTEERQRQTPDFLAGC